MAPRRLNVATRKDAPERLTALRCRFATCDGPLSAAARSRPTASRNPSAREVPCSGTVGAENRFMVQQLPSASAQPGGAGRPQDLSPERCPDSEESENWCLPPLGQQRVTLGITRRG